MNSKTIKCLSKMFVKNENLCSMMQFYIVNPSFKTHVYIVVRSCYKLYAANKYKFFVEYSKAAKLWCRKNNQISKIKIRIVK